MTIRDLETFDVDELEEAEVSRAYREATRISAAALSRMLSQKPAAADRGGKRRLLTAQEDADRLSVSPDWLYKRPALPFVVKLDGATRYDERKLERWLKQRADREA